MIKMMSVKDMADWLSGDWDPCTLREVGEFPIEKWNERVSYPSHKVYSGSHALTYSVGMMQALMESIKQHGLKRPLRMTEDYEWSETPVLTNGHHRWWCVWQLGLTEVPVANDWRDEQDVYDTYADMSGKYSW